MSNRFLMSVLLMFCFINIIIAQESVGRDTIKRDSEHLQKKKEKFTDNENTANPSESSPILIKEDEIVEFEGDTAVYTNKKGNPLVATLCSMAVPGLGQAYNKKYWKIPIIYTIFGSMYFFARNNHQKYKDFKFAYKNYETDLKPIWVSENIKEDYLKNRMEFYKRNRNFNIIVGGIFYLLNILDANVDAHLMDFDVGDDLSLRLEPEMNYMYASNSKTPNFGLKFVFAINTKSLNKNLKKYNF